jgi:hypothetical protein
MTMLYWMNVYVGTSVVMVLIYAPDGINSASGPIKLSNMGKKKSPFTTPIIMTANRSQKKWRTMNSNGDVDNIKTANNDVNVPWITGANAVCNAKRTRRSRLPTDVIKPCF